MSMHFKVNQSTPQEWIINSYFPNVVPTVYGYMSIFHYHHGEPKEHCGIENYSLAEDRVLGVYTCLKCKEKPPDNLIKTVKLLNFMGRI